MALMLNYTWRGISIPNAYVRVDNVYGGKRENVLVPGETEPRPLWRGTVGVYADANEYRPIYAFSVEIPFDTEVAPLPLLYNKLKELPEFQSAIDC